MSRLSTTSARALASVSSQSQRIRCAARIRPTPPLLPSSPSRIAQLHSNSRSSQAKTADAFDHGQTELKDGKPVAELAKEDERKLSGVPQEPGEGPPPTPIAAIPAHALFSLHKRTIIVAGAARGLGLTIARALLESGANVAALDVLPEPAAGPWAEAQAVAHDRNVSLTYGHLDVTDQKEIHDKFQEIFDSAPENAPVRGLFVSAGIQLMAPAVDYKVEDFKKVVDVNLTGTFMCAQAFGKEYLRRHPHEGGAVDKVEDSLAPSKGASIVMTASMSGSIANQYIECVAYNASKAGVVQLGKNLAMEWGKGGIRVNTLSPGYIRTAMTAAQLKEKPEFNDQWLGPALLGRISTPDEYRGPAIFLLSEASSFMTGTDLMVDGGHSAT